MTQPSVDVPRRHYNDLSKVEIDLLLKTLRSHRTLLQFANSDTQRLIAEGVRPCYVLDYQEIHVFIYGDTTAYMKERGRQAGSLVPLEYLLDQENIEFIIGPGTVVEIAHRASLITRTDLPFLHSLAGHESGEILYKRFVKTGDISNCFEPGFRELKRLLEASQSDSLLPLQRLAYLLEKDNVKFYDQVSNDMRSVIDEKVFVEVLSHLAAMRPGVPYPNFADALNCAFVCGMRKMPKASRYQNLFPYLLTDTATLLNEERWANDQVASTWGLPVALSRRPLTAAYSSIASHLISDPAKLNEQIMKLLSIIDESEERLLTSFRIQRTTDSHTVVEWEDLLTSGRISEKLTQKADYLEPFIGDKLVRETQRMLNLTRLSLANRMILIGRTFDVRDPQKLFDVLISVSQVVTKDGIPEEIFRASWDRLIDERVYKGDSYNVLELYNKGGGTSEFLYIHIESNRDGYFSFSWPTTKKIEELLELAAEAYARHGISRLMLFVGIGEKVLPFEATLPVTTEELLEQVGGQIRWVRFESEAFDIYFDIFTRYNNESKVGVIVREPNRHHLVDFYQTTACRFLFTNWLMRALDEAALPSDKK